MKKIIAVLAAAFVLAACGARKDYNDADVQFARMMIAHHQQALVMTELASTRAKDPELKQLAAGIKVAQQTEIDKMNGWLGSWGQTGTRGEGRNMPGMTSMPGQMSAQDLESLEALTGTDFDRSFARKMISHHTGAVQMARDAQKNGKSPRVKELAAAIERTQTAEVQRLQAILDRLR
jgi:uncharacterized protein (DUF305 family)